MPIIKKRFTKGIILKADDVGVDGITGELKVGLTSQRLHVFLEGQLRTVVTQSQTQTLTSKTIDADTNTIQNLEVDNLKAGVLNTDSTLTGATDTQLPSALAVKTAIDTINADIVDDVEGPASSTDNAIVRFDGTTGKLIQNSTVLIDDLGVINRSAGLTLYASAGDLTFTPVNTGKSTFNYAVKHNNAVFRPSFTNATAGANVSITVGDKSTIILTAATSVDTLIPHLDYDGQIVTLINGTAAPILLNNETGAVAGARIITGTGTNFSLPVGAAVSLIYSTVTSRWSITGAAGVKGPTTSTDNTLPRFDGTTGQVIQGSGIAVSDTNAISGATIVASDNTITTAASGNLTSTELNAALSELQTDIDTRALQSDLSTTNSDLANHINDATDAHDASAISVVPAGNLTSTDVQSALTELQTDVDTASTAITDHINDAVDAHDATAVSVTPFPGIASTTVQAALEETYSTLNTKVTANGGTLTDGQVITPSRLDVKQDTIANLTTYAATATNGQIVFATDEKKMYQIVDNSLVPVGSGSGTGGGVTDVNALAIQNFDSATLGDFTQVGLSLDSTTPIHGTTSAKLTHQTGTSPTNDQYFKQVIAVDEKFRGQNMTISLDVASTASQGNAVISVYDETNAAVILASSQLQASTTPVKSSFAFDIPATCLSLSYTVKALPEAGSPTTEVDDIVIELTSSYTNTIGLIQEADSYVRVSGANSFGTTNTTVVKFPTIKESKGTSVSYNSTDALGTSFTILEDGIYTITGYVSTGANVSIQDIGITKNCPNLTTSVSGISDDYLLSFARDNVNTASTVTKFASFSWTGDLLANDVIRIQGALGNTPASGQCTVTKQGSLKQVNVNSNQKITIPTSELRFEGASSRGSVATAIVKFDTLAKIRGDAFEVVSTAADGTYVRMLKAGKLDVSASIYINGSTTSLAISKNQATLTALAVTSEIIAVQSNATTGAGGSFNASGESFVGVGDIIRVSVDPTSTLANVRASLNLSFQEQEIQVSVSNTLPQFSESDSSVRVDTSAGYGTSATRIRVFSTVRHNVGTDVEYIPSATNGDSFVVKTDGVYNITYTDTFTVSSTLSITVNESGTLSSDASTLGSPTILGRSATPAANLSDTISWQGYLSAGSVIRAHTNAGVNNGISSFTMSKVGKPNVTGVDVTPFVNVPQPVTQSATLYQTSNISNSLITGALTTNTNNGLFSYNSTTGIYTVLKNCELDLNLSLRASTGVSVLAEIRIDSTIVSTSHSNASAGHWDSCSWNGLVNAGQTFSFLNNAATISDQQKISVVATALSDQILTAPETFSTDTAALTYASSSQYTLSTLASAPVGTYITFTYAASTNTRTQTTTRPTQTDADMNTNGIQLFTRAYNAASTAAQPAAIAIQIGKGMKGTSLNLYKSAGKVTSGEIDYYMNPVNVQAGIIVKSYSPDTGILVIDSGWAGSTSVSSSLFLFSDVSSATSGYLTINASKNPALTGFGLNRVAARYTSDSGQAIGTGATLITFEDVVSDTHNAYSAGVYTVPETGYYLVTAKFTTATVTLTTTQAASVQIFVNGSLNSLTTTRGNGAANPYGVQVTDIIYFKKGDTISIYGNSTVATSMQTTAGYNSFSISKVGN